MSFFDHVRCPKCNAQIDPENLPVGQQGPHCPKCKSTLSVTDLFGVMDAFRDEDEPNLTLDDLVPGGRPAQRGGGDDDDRPMGLDALVPMKRRP